MENAWSAPFNPIEPYSHAMLIQRQLFWCKMGDATLGTFTLKFEQWSYSIHGSSQVITSYRGWINVRNLPHDICEQKSIFEL